jgi:hypothetical protein
MSSSLPKTKWMIERSIPTLSESKCRIINGILRERSKSPGLPLVARNPVKLESLAAIIPAGAAAIRARPNLLYAAAVMRQSFARTW